MRKKIIQLLLVFALIIVAAATGYYFIFYKPEKKVDKFITLYGNIDIRQVNLGFRVSGRIKEMLFDEGDLIKPGQVIAKLDKTTYVNDLNKSVGDLNQARANYQKMMNGTRKEDIQQAFEAMKEAEANLKNSEILYERQINMPEQGAISKQDFDNTDFQKKQAFAKYSKLKEAYNLSVNGFRKEDKAYARAQVQTSTALVAASKTNLKDTEIVAPNEGIVLTRVLEPGSIVSPTSTVYTLSLTKPVWARTYIDETQLGLVYPGMKAKVYTDARPDKPYDGIVGYISPVAEFTPKNVETTSLRTDLVYRIRVVIDKTDEFLRQGMPVTIKIEKNVKESQKHEQ